MNRIEEMIREMCPEGVRRVKLGEVCENLDRLRKPITGHNRVAGEIPYYGASGVVDYVKDYIFDEDLLLISEDGANLIARNTPIAFSISGKTWVNNHAHVLRFKEYSTRKLVEFYLNMLDITPWISGGAQPKLNQENLNKIQIPLPPLPIQQEIVNILDNFTNLQQNLEDELKLRQKQYEYYREKLLTFEEGECNQNTIGNLSRLVTKQTGFDYSSKIKPALIKKKEEGAIPFLQTRNFSGKEFEYNTEFYVPKEIVDQFPKITLNERCLLLSIVGASIGNIGLFPRTEICFLGGAICVVKVNKETNLDYLYYYMQSWNGQKQILEKTKGAGQATVTIEDIRNFVIDLPPLDRQLQITQTLDHFESLISNLKTEIELRKKQYEYYREKLLTF